MTEKEFIKKAKATGIVGLDAVNAYIAETGTSPEQLYAVLAEEGITIQDSGLQLQEETNMEAEAAEVAATEALVRAEEGDEESYNALGGEEEAMDAADAKAAADELLDDPVKNYLKQIGQIPLLNAEQEIMYSKRIRAGAEAARILQQDRKTFNRESYIKKNGERFSFEDDGNDEPLLDEEEAQEEAQLESEEAALNAPLDDDTRRELLHTRTDGLAARRELSEANLRLVVSIAKKHVGRNLAFLDLIQEGNIGLIKAAEKFDCERGFRFSTYATWWIRQAITRAIADQARTIRIPVHMVETINRMRQTTNNLIYQKGREPSTEELAAAMDMTVERVREIQRMAQEPASLESPVGEEEDSSLGDFVPDETAEAPGKAADRAMVAQQINEALKTLTPREERVIRLRFGLDDGRPRTLEEVGKDFGVTRERVRQIEAKAIRKLHSRKCMTLLGGLID